MQTFTKVPSTLKPYDMKHLPSEKPASSAPRGPVGIAAASLLSGHGPSCQGRWGRRPSGPQNSPAPANPRPRWRLPFRMSLLAGVSPFMSGLSHTRHYYRRYVSELLLPHLQLSSQPGLCPRLFQMSLNKVTCYTWRNHHSQGCLARSLASQAQRLPERRAPRKKGSVQWVMSHQRTKCLWQIMPKQNKLAVKTPLFFPSPNTK